MKSEDHKEDFVQWARAFSKSQEGKEAKKRQRLYPAGRFQNLKSNAKVRGLSLTVTKEQYIELIKLPCFYCEKVTFGIVGGGGLDRIDNQKGYDMENILPCCGECNRLRGDQLTVNETKVAVKAILKFRQQEAKYEK